MFAPQGEVKRESGIGSELAFPASGNPNRLHMHPGSFVELPEQIEYEAKLNQAARILRVTLMSQVQSPPGFLEAKDIFGPVRFRSARLSGTARPDRECPIRGLDTH